MGAQGRWIQSSHLMECKSKRQQGPRDHILHLVVPFAWWLSAGAHQMTPQKHGGRKWSSACRIAQLSIQGDEGEGVGIIVRVIQRLCEPVHSKQTFPALMLLPVELCALLLCSR